MCLKDLSKDQKSLSLICDSYSQIFIVEGKSVKNLYSLEISHRDCFQEVCKMSHGVTWVSSVMSHNRPAGCRSPHHPLPRVLHSCCSRKSGELRVQSAGLSRACYHLLGWQRRENKCVQCGNPQQVLHLHFCCECLEFYPQLQGFCGSERLGDVHHHCSEQLWRVVSDSGTARSS